MTSSYRVMGLSFEDTVDHSPLFKVALSREEASVSDVEKRLNRLLDLLQRREEENRKIIQTSRLINMEFQQLISSPTSPLRNSVKMYTAAMDHWEESNERHNEQIRMVLTEPLMEFIQTDFKKVDLRKQQYHNAVKEHNACSTEYAECKQDDILRLHAASSTLFNAQYNLTRLAARYVLQLKLFPQKVDIFLTTQLSELITTYLSHHQLGSNIALEVEGKRDISTTALQNSKLELEETTTSLRDNLRTVLTRAERGQTLKLLNLQLYDLHMKDEATKTAARLNDYTNIEEIAPATPPDEMSGYLWVGEKSPVFGYTWYKCWCAVQRGMLILQNEERNEQRVNLKLCQVKTDSHNVNRAFVFTLFSPVKPLVLQAQSSQEKETWVMIIHKAIANAISSLHAQYSISDESSSGKKEGRVKDSVMPLSVLKELQEIPGNEICADCSKKKPTWASLNLGVLICIECSGVHRGLGVQISQVRSLTLDALSDEQISSLKRVGNALANQIYEAELDSGKSLSTNAERKDFIARKYKELTFTSSKYHDLITESRKCGSQKTLAAVQDMPDIPPANPSSTTPISNSSNNDTVTSNNNMNNEVTSEGPGTNSIGNGEGNEDIVNNENVPTA